jgi:uncharacterized repeat protein (TIGR01451 family)
MQMQPFLGATQLCGGRAGVARVFVATLITLSLQVASVDTARAQGISGGILADGNAVVTGFSLAPPPTLIAPGIDPADRTYIDLNGPALRVIDLQAPGAPPQSQALALPKPFTVTAGQIGQVFAVALDNATPPNIYVAATSVYGLPIVTPDRDGDGLPDREKEGSVRASFMLGLFGPAVLGGGPGSIWRIDGEIGTVSLFANVTLDGVPNSGPALGGLAFDPVTNSLFVADRQTGMIHRFDMTGTERGRYDHGLQGRAAAGMPRVRFDAASRVNISNRQFRPADPSTWGYAPPSRRIFGLAVHAGRLYYAVAEGLQIWSVGLAPDGAFRNDPRIEIRVPPGMGSTEISKIAFDDQGRMLLAERAAPTGAYDFIKLTQEGGGRVLRYALVPSVTGQAWQPVPDEYAIGFSAQMRSGSGGVAVGYGYDVNGTLDHNACGGFVWVTGEQLLARGGSPNVSGLQGGDIDMVRAANIPRQNYFVDYYVFSQDPKARGHLGDVVVFRDCTRVAIAQLPPALPGAPGLGVPAAPAGGAPGVPPFGDGGGPAMPPGGAGQQGAPPGVPPGGAGQQGAPPANFDLTLAKTGPAKCTVGQQCTFNITVQNLGPGDYQGAISVEDVSTPGLTLSGPSPMPHWTCAATAAGAVKCDYGQANLPSGIASTLGMLIVNFTVPANLPAQTTQIKNCAKVIYGGGKPDANPADDEHCITIAVEQPPAQQVPDIVIEKMGPGSCAPGKRCDFIITVRGASSTPFTGAVEIKDDPPAGWTFNTSSSPLGLWNCPSPTNCTYNITQNPHWPKGGFTTNTVVGFGLSFDVPANAKQETVKNCVTATLTPAVGPKTTKTACANIAVEQPPGDIIIEKMGPALCAPGTRCDFIITVRGASATPFTGAVEIKDDPPAGWTFNTSSSPLGLWNCPAPTNCTYNITQNPHWPKGGFTTNTVVGFGLSFDVPANAMQETVKNCVTATLTPPSGPKTTKVACANVPIGFPPKPVTKEPGLKISKNHIGGDATHPACFIGKDCKWHIRVSGSDAAPYVKPIKIEEELPPSFDYVDHKPIGAAGWTCYGQQNKVTCTHPPANLTNNDFLDLEITARMDFLAATLIYPNPYSCLSLTCRYPEVKNCATVIYDNQQQYQQEPPPPPPALYWRACDKQKISWSFVNLWNYSAAGSGPCYPPTCSFYDFTITGRERFSRGPLSQRITPPPGSAFPKAYITKSAPLCPASRWSCTRTDPEPDGAFTCSIADCVLAPGEQVVVRIDGSVAPDLKEPPPTPLEKTACGVLEWETPTGGGIDIEQLGGKHTKQACATIIVLARAPPCAAGYVKSPDGQCCLASNMTTSGECCPAGYRVAGDSCVRAGPSAVPVPVAPSCADGQFWNGQACVCPEGLQWNGRSCVRAGPSAVPVPMAPSCTGGRFWNGQACVCPEGLQWNGRSCVRRPPPPPRCTGGQFWNGQACVCPEGQQWNGRVCVRRPPPPPQCTGGKVPAGNRCVCPAGTTETHGRCMPIPRTPPPPQCTGGKVPAGNRCVCPPGTTDMHGRCMPIPRTPIQPQIKQQRPGLPPPAKAQPKTVIPQIEQLGPR